MTQTVYIVGLGLIGGSVALGIKRNHPEHHIIGFDRNSDSCQVALTRGMVDDIAQDFASAVPQADYMIFAVPIGQTYTYLRELASLAFKDNLIISDTGSTKAGVTQLAEQVLAKTTAQFIGGHPMAGSHKSGARAADVNLFENAYYILTPSQLTKPTTITKIRELLSGLHARFIEVDAHEHDCVTAQISHFPHVLAALLVEQSSDYSQVHELTQHLAAGGFRDMTRIAESESNMWTSILLSNKSAILERIENFQQRLAQISDQIKKSDEGEIKAFFDQARQARQAMEIHGRSGGEVTYDLQVLIPDEEDEILQVLELLRGTSLVNVQILENNREDINGTLRISFRNQKDLAYAKKQIETHTSHQITSE